MYASILRAVFSEQPEPLSISLTLLFERSKASAKSDWVRPLRSLYSANRMLELFGHSELSVKGISSNRFGIMGGDRRFALNLLALTIK